MFSIPILEAPLWVYITITAVSLLRRFLSVGVSSCNIIGLFLCGGDRDIRGLLSTCQFLVSRCHSGGSGSRFP